MHASSELAILMSESKKYKTSLNVSSLEDAASPQIAHVAAIAAEDAANFMQTHLTRSALRRDMLAQKYGLGPTELQVILAAGKQLEVYTTKVFCDTVIYVQSMLLIS